jgi:hypothetical protein
MSTTPHPADLIQVMRAQPDGATRAGLASVRRVASLASGALAFFTAALESFAAAAGRPNDC